MTSIAVGKSLTRDRGTRIAFAVFLLITVALNARILTGEGVPNHGDLTYPWLLDNYEANYRYLFNDAGSISNMESVDRTLVLAPLVFVARLLGEGPGFVHKLVFFGLTLASLLSMWGLIRFLARRLEQAPPPVTVSVAASALFAFSPWVMEVLPAYLFWLAYALTPLLLVRCFLFVEAPTFRNAFWLALTTTVIGTTPHYFAYSVVIIWVIVISSFVGVRRIGRDSGRIPTLTVMRGLLLVFAILACLNSYWLGPTWAILTSGNSISPGYTLDPSQTKLFSANSTPWNVLRGFDQWIYWYSHDPRMGYVFNRAWIANSLILPLACLLALGRAPLRHSRHLLAMAALALAFGTLALGTRTPLYELLAFRVPGFREFGWLLRVPGKLSYLLWLLYPAIFAFAMGRFLRGKASHMVKRAVLHLAILSIGILVLPKAVLYYWDYYAPVAQPSAYRDLHDFLAPHNGPERVLYLAPYESAIGRNSLNFEASYIWNSHRVATATPAISSPIPSVGYYHLTYRDWQSTLYRDIYPDLPPDIGRRYLSRPGIRYVVYHNDLVGGTRQGQRDLEALRASDLREVRTFDFITVFENPTVKPPIRVEGLQDPSAVEVRKLDPTRYQVTLPTTSRPTTLLLSQPFDPLWRVVLGDGRSVEPRPHSSVEMQFRIPVGAPPTIRLEYFPQQYFDSGLAISSLSLLVLGFLVGASHFRNKQRGGNTGRAESDPQEVGKLAESRGPNS